MNKKKIIKNIVFIVVFITATFYVLLKDKSLTDIWNAISNVNMSYIILGSLCACIYILCEGINIRTLVSTISSKISLVNGIKYACIGFFFSSITPSSSGGQPMQVYYMKKNGVAISTSTLALLVELISFQFVTLLLAFVLFISKYTFIIDKISFILPFLIFGAVVNILIVLFIIFVILSENLATKVMDYIIKFLHKVKIIKNVEKAHATSVNHISQFKQGVTVLKESRPLFIKVFFTTLVQFVSLYSVVFFVYRAFGLGDSSYLDILALQAMFTLAMSSLPLPGAVGISEGSFLKVYNLIIPQNLITSALLIYRGLSFYMLLILTAIVVLVVHLQHTVHKTSDEKA